MNINMIIMYHLSNPLLVLFISLTLAIMPIQLVHIDIVINNLNENILIRLF